MHSNHLLDAEELIQKGLAASRAADVEAALEFFRQASIRVPGSGLPHFLLGAELAQMGRSEDAERAYANAVLLSPELDMARFQLGLLQFTADRAAVALVTWEPLFARSPEEPLQRIVHGFAALARDDLAAARHCFSEGMALNTGNPALNDDLQRLMARMDRSSAPSESAHGEAGSPDELGNHVLLSNYHRQGRLH